MAATDPSEPQFDLPSPLASKFFSSSVGYPTLTTPFQILPYNKSNQTLSSADFFNSKPPSSCSSAASKPGAAIDALAAASDALAAASKALAAAVAAARPVDLKPETKALLDNPTRNPASIADPVNYELHYKSLFEKARKALEYYKDTKDEEFELVEMAKFENTLLFPYWATHITFMAKLKDIPDSCPKLFFAEIYERGDHLGVYEVKMCMTMDPSGPDVMKGCEYVQGDKDMLHPKGVKFWACLPSGTLEWDKENGLGSSSPNAC